MKISTRPLRSLPLTSAFAGLALALAGCSGDDAASASDSETASGASLNPTASSSGASESESESGGSATDSESGGGSATDSATGTTGTMTTTDGPTTAATESTTASESESGTTEGVSASESESESETGESDSESGESDSETGDEPCEPQDGGGGDEFSYLWISNTNQGSVSKIDAYAISELARYYTDEVQSGAASPSRTSVSLDGRFIVVSNRDRGTITKIAANEADCVDRNNDGVIQTSPNKDTLLAFADEECRLWTTKLTENLHQWGPRATSFGIPKWNYDTCAYEEEKIWVGYMISATQARFARLSGATGDVEATVDLPEFPLYASYSPYGAAIDPQGNVWTTGVFSRAAIRIDAETLDVQRWDSPDADSHYGMTIDSEGRVWFANWQGHGGVSFFDPSDESWVVIPGSTGNIFRGIAADNKGGIWAAANGGGALGCGLIQIDADSQTVVQFHQFAQCGSPLGVGFDGKGFLWLVDYSGWTWRMDTQSLEKTQLIVPNLHYTYSDFTGSGLSGVVIPQ